MGVPRLGRKGHYARLLRIAVYVYMDAGLFLLYRRVDLYLLEIGVWGRFDVEIAQACELWISAGTELGELSMRIFIWWLPGAKAGRL